MKKRFGRLSTIILSGIVIGGLLSPNIADASKSNEVNQDFILPSITYKHDEKQAPMKFNGQIRKIAYLTIDDGPSRYSDKLIDILNQYKVPATFFLIGSNVDLYPQYVKQFHERGDYVGMHSMTHDYNKLYKKGEVVSEMKQVQQKIHALTNETPILFRSPYGSNPGLTKNLRDQVVKAGLKTWDWSIDSNDWRYQKNPPQIVAEIKKQLKRPVEIILIHDKKGTIEALPQIIETIQAAGYEFDVYDESKHFMVNFTKDDRL
ncbi:polysaccharide deacetylase family protein [Bacillus massiliigorillae]|uniref:polysaccharide deacetylase family protein n=1 Tax=Bacillus massiliigorillae TaxID=1243664 RepID=UPI0003A54707|nr:polysaccharide deacetylase family protein [Bacillus massiliigorillae]